MTEQRRCLRAFGRMEQVTWPTAHHRDEPVHARRQVRPLAQHRGDVGQRAERDERQRTGFE